MGKFFGSSNVALNTRQRLENKYNSARSNLLIAIVFTLVNIGLLFFDSSAYFLFSLYLPYYLALFGYVLSGKMPEEMYVDEWADLEILGGSFLAFTLVIAVIVILLYVFSWLFSKKRRVGWLIFALVLAVIDTIVTLYLLGIAADSIIDIAFHIWFVVSLIGGIDAHYKLKKMPVEEVEETVDDTLMEDSVV